MPDDVQLPDLEVISRYSLAVRSATAPREEVVAALEADLAWLTAGARRRRPTAAPRSAPPARSRAVSAEEPPPARAPRRAARTSTRKASNRGAGEA